MDFWFWPDAYKNEYFRRNMGEMVRREFENHPWGPFGLFHWLKEGIVWSEWQETLESRLIKHLENKAFFQPTGDNPLNGGHDILTFLLINPRVFKSPKIKPLLKVSLTNDILNRPNIDKAIIRSLECILNDNEHPSLS